MRNRYETSGHVSEIGYGDWEIHFVDHTTWAQFVNLGDSVRCRLWKYYVRNDSLMRSGDDISFHFTGHISRFDDTIMLEKGYATIWLVPYHEDTLPGNWSDNVVIE